MTLKGPDQASLCDELGMKTSYVHMKANRSAAQALDHAFHSCILYDVRGSCIYAQRLTLLHNLQQEAA